MHALRPREMEGVGQEVQGARLRIAAHAALQGADGIHTDACVLGQGFLGQPGLDPVASEDRPKGQGLWGGPLRAEMWRTAHQTNLPSIARMLDC